MPYNKSFLNPTAYLLSKQSSFRDTFSGVKRPNNSRSLKTNILKGQSVPHVPVAQRTSFEKFFASEKPIHPVAEPRHLVVSGNELQTRLKLISSASKKENATSIKFKSNSNSRIEVKNVELLQAVSM